MTLYQEVVKAGIPHDHHESDLYVKMTRESQPLIENYEGKASVLTFVSDIDGEVWYDVPFAYDPFWKGK